MEIIHHCTCGCTQTDEVDCTEPVKCGRGVDVKFYHVPTSYSFACGGWLQFWMFGVAKALQVYGLEKHATIAGCSAGALAAAGLCCGGDFDKAVEFCKKELIPEARRDIRGLFNLTSYERRALVATANLENWKLLDKNLVISVTKLPYFTGELVDTFSSYDDLLDTLLASAAAFPLANCIYRRGAYFLDGGLSNFQPCVDASSVTISPFYCLNADITPSRYVPIWWAFVPPADGKSIDWLYDLGLY